MTTEKELFLTLVRLRCVFPIEDLRVRFNLSLSSISRIWITWIDFLHSQLGMLPIWESKETIVKTMPYYFKSKYPTTRIILDCTELFRKMPTSWSQAATFLSATPQHCNRFSWNISKWRHYICKWLYMQEDF